MTQTLAQKFNPNRQTPGQRRLHHRSREDRQRTAYDVLRLRINSIRAGQPPPGTHPSKLALYEREAGSLARKLNL